MKTSNKIIGIYLGSFLLFTLVNVVMCLVRYHHTLADNQEQASQFTRNPPRVLKIVPSEKKGKKSFTLIEVIYPYQKVYGTFLHFPGEPCFYMASDTLFIPTFQSLVIWSNALEEIILPDGQIHHVPYVYREEVY